MKDWMNSLASHYEVLRNKYPDERLMVVFDIDGTILDMRHTVLHALKCFDRNYGTHYFRGIRIPDIDFHEDRLPDLLERLKIPAEDRRFIEEQYEKLLFSSTSVLESHRPFRGVLEVIRWFQLQPNTFVGLNTGRPESLRFNTLRSLNQLGTEYRVIFEDGLLFMNKDMERSITRTKALGIEHFKNLGFRIVAVVDNEPENLEAISEAGRDYEFLLLHADTIFKSREESVPGHAVKGKEYDFTKLVSKESIPKHTQFVWHCDNTWTNLDSFLRSNIRWIEIDLRGFYPYMQTGVDGDFGRFTLDQCLALVKEHKKAIKLDLHGGGHLIDRVAGIIRNHDIDASSLWFQGSYLVLGETGFQLLRLLYPYATLQCPVDIFASVVGEEPAMVREKLLMLQRWGINRFAVNWSTPKKRRLLSCLRQWGFETDLYNVAATGSFLRASLLLPDSITARFNASARQSNQGYQTGRGEFSPDYSIFRRVA
jgi:hypothetical protein